MSAKNKLDQYFTKPEVEKITTLLSLVLEREPSLLILKVYSLMILHLVSTVVINKIFSQKAFSQNRGQSLLATLLLVKIPV